MSKIKVIYCSSMCSEAVFERYFKKINNKPGQQVQKYHRTLLKGFSCNNTVEIEAISKIPLNSSNHKKRYVRGEREKWNDMTICYLPILNMPILGKVYQLFSTFWYVWKRVRKQKTVVIIDVLNLSMNQGVLLACKLTKTKVVGIVTDLPEMLIGNSAAFFVRLGNKTIKQCDAYILLTEAMNEKINVNYKKPYVVIEGQVDSEMALRKNELAYKGDKRVCLYSGSLNAVHGIKYLVEGFELANMDNVELHIYGEGDYTQELLDVCRRCDNIKYFGVQLNDIVVNAQIKATLLVNPRPTNQEFVKYSFPSKNMEYMASGTPVLTTCLPGMPKEYEEYVYLLKDETKEGMSKKLTEIMYYTNEILHSKGQSAKAYVMMHKTGEMCAKKIIQMLRELM